MKRLHLFNLNRPLLITVIKYFKEWKKIILKNFLDLILLII